MIGAILIVVGLYLVLWGKYKENKEKEKDKKVISDVTKGCSENGRMAQVKQDIEVNSIEVQKVGGSVVISVSVPRA